MTVTLFALIHNMSPVWWGVVSASLLFTFLSGIVFWQDTSKRSNKFFFFFGAVVGIWGLCGSLFYASLSTPLVYSALFILYFISALVPLAGYLFLYAFSTEKTPFSFWKTIILFVPYLAITTTLAFPDFVVGYRNMVSDAKEGITFGSGYLFYSFYILALLVACHVILIRKYRESAGIFKIAIRNFLITLFSVSVVAVISMLFLPIPKGMHDYFWVGHLSVVLFGFISSYILAKYNFWSVKIISTEFFISIIILFLIIELFLATSVLSLFIKAGITLLIIFSSSFLIGSVKREIQSKDKITRLLHDLDLMYARLKVLDKKKSNFLTIASHHLRDPLTVITGYASMLTEGTFGELPVPVKEGVGKIFESSRRLVTMISDFMDISNIESGNIQYKFVDIDMKKLVLDLATEMKLNAEKVHLGFEVKVGEGVFQTVGDSGKLRQVISNLMDNAIKYSPHGTVSVALGKSTDGGKIVTSISDNGIGMNTITIEKLFNKFSRAEGVSKVYTEGSGLGLYVAKEIVAKHGGRIWADSKGEGMGSTFFIELNAKK